MRKITLLLLVTVFSIVAHSQITFQRNYNPGGLMDLFSAVEQTTDDGYIMTGSKIDIFGSTFVVIKTDTAGTVEWAKEYTKSGFFTSVMSNDIILTNDGGYMVTGSDGGDFFLVKLDAAGNVSWTKTYSKAEEDTPYSVFQTSDNGYLVTGTTRLTTNDSTSAVFFKVNSTGTLLWAQHWDYLAGTNDALYSASECSDGYIAVGYMSEIDDQGTPGTSDDDTTSNIIIVKVDLSGSNPTGKVYGVLADSEQAHDILKTATDEYIVTGYTSATASGLFDGGDVLLLSIDNAGNKLMAATYDVGDADNGESVIQTASGGYAVIGYTITGLTTMENFLIDVTSAGVFNFGLEYTGGPSFYMMADGVQTSDGGFIWGTLGTDNSYDFYLIKTDDTGHSNCWENDMTTSSTSWDPTISTIAGTFTATISSGSITINAADATIGTNTPECIIVPCDTPTVSISPIDPIICVGQSQTLTASGAVSYEWSTTAATASINVTPAATTSYTVTGYDASGICPSSPVSVTVTVNALPLINAGSNSPICVGDNLNFTESGGDATTWSWTGPGGFTSLSQNPTVASVTTADAGTYYVTVSDGTCDNSASVDVTVNTLPNAQITGDSEICYGETATLTATGGGTYLWNTGESTATITVSPLITTTYSVTVNNGCEASASFQVKVNPLPAISFTGDTIICNGDATTITASGGDTYLWNTAETTPYITVSPIDTTTYYVTATNSTTLCENNDSITVYVTEKPVIVFSGNTEICQGDTTIITVSGGTTYLWSTGSVSDNISVNPTDTIIYYVTATTTCENNDSVVVNVNPLPNLLISGVTEICFGDTTILTAGGADTYSWGSVNSDNIQINPLSDTVLTLIGTFTATSCYSEIQQSVTVNSLPLISFTGNTEICFGDNASITALGGDVFIWNTGDNTSNINVSPTSNTNYYVTVTNNTTTCVNNDSINVQVNSLPITTVSNDTTICFGGSANIWATGGDTYAWSPISTLTNYNSPNAVATPNVTTTYVVLVTDSNTCSNTDTVIVNVLQEPYYDITIQNVLCFGEANGQASISNFAGANPASYIWSTGSSSDTLYNLPADSYNLTITDSIGCQYIESVIIGSPEALTDSIEITNLDCFGDNDGSIYPYMYGGTPPYTSYQWSNGGFNDHLSNIGAGTYSLTVTDANGCTYIIDKIDITQPEELIASTISITNVNCNGDSNGSVLTDITGGVEAYSFTWNNGSTNQNISDLSAGTYILTVTDNNNCIDTTVATVSEPGVLTLSDSIFYNDYEGAIILNAIGGAPDYSYQWSNGETTSSINNLFGGVYFVTITDANNCIITASYNIEIPVIIPSVITPNADGVNDNFEITNIKAFEKVDISIFNRWGDKLFEYSGTGTGYSDASTRWDGKYKGKDLPLGSYIYIVDLHNGNDVYNGVVTIVR